MSVREQADQIIKNHVLWSAGGGLVPIPMFDIAAVTAVQTDMLRQIAKLYEVDLTESTGKAFVAALAGTSLAKIGSSFIKAVPVFGSVIGGLSMSITSGASTYALGQVALNHFEGGGTIESVDLKWAKQKYEQAYEKGKDFVASVKEEGTKTVDSVVVPDEAEAEVPDSTHEDET